MARVFAAVLVVLALAGCSTTTAPEPQLSAKELAERRHYIDDMSWAATGLGEEYRPVTPALSIVSMEDWPSAWVKCMNTAGFDEYVAVEGGYTTGDEQEAPSDAERIAEYVCNLSFEIEGRYENWYNDAEIDYLYSYYQQVLVPCLATRGFPAVASPTRDEFADNFASWHPYFSVGASQQDALFEDIQNYVSCPPTPAGIPDPNLSTLWGHP